LASLIYKFVTLDPSDLVTTLIGYLSRKALSKALSGFGSIGSLPGLGLLELLMMTFACECALAYAGAFYNLFVIPVLNLGILLFVIV